MSRETEGRPGRRRALQVLGGLGLAGVAAAVGLAPARTNAYYQGPVSDHFDGLKFFNPGGPKPKGFADLARWQFGTRGEAWPAAYPSPFADVPPDRVGEGQLRIAHIGHASFLVQTAGLSILIDPVYQDRVSPVSFAGPRRINAPGIAFDKLPRVDVVLVTHNHYDHMDTDAVGRLWVRDRPQILTPLGNDTILRAGMPGLEARPLDWGDNVEVARGVRIHAVPTQHWSARGTRDRQHALWASFVIETPAHVVYCIGDTGFGDGGTFRRIAAVHPRIDVALLPIGAYEPRWFMRDQHINPQEAVEIFRIVGAGRAIGHHWGTFRLTNEGVERPAEALGVALQHAAIAPDRFYASRPGQVLALDA